MHRPVSDDDQMITRIDTACSRKQPKHQRAGRRTPAFDAVERESLSKRERSRHASRLQQHPKPCGELAE